MARISWDIAFGIIALSIVLLILAIAAYIGYADWAPLE
jgi:hypothetical protein